MTATFTAENAPAKLKLPGAGTRIEVRVRSADYKQITKAYRYRLYPTKRQIEALNEQLGFACDLYNAALEQRRDWWKRGRSTGFYEQCRELTDVQRPEGMNRMVQEDVLRRLDRAFQAFFRRLKAGEKAGYPRFRSRRRYDTLTWRRKKGGAAIRNNRLRLQGIGHVKVRWHRDLPSEPLTTTVRRMASGKWYVTFAIKVDAKPLPRTGQDVGLDLGISTFAACSNGEMVRGPRATRAAEKDLRRANRRLHRRKRGSNRRAKARAQLAKQHEHIANQRRDHAHKSARALVDRFDTIYVEDLNVAGMGRNRTLARDIHDQGWAQFLAILRAKAEEAGREVVAVNPRNTSQLCSSCGELVPKPLSQRVHRCDCGYEADRDVNAARNVLAAGRVAQARTVGVPAVV